jgi:hypothetical protein
MIEYKTITAKGLDAFNDACKDLRSQQFCPSFGVFVNTIGTDLYYTQQWMRTIDSDFDN